MVAHHRAVASVGWRTRSEAATLMWMFAAQATAAVLMSRSNVLASAHVLATVTVAVLALLSRRPERIAMTAAYVAGVENLWRISHATMPYALSQYLLLVLLLGLVLQRRRTTLPALPLLFMGLLLPGAALAVFDIGWGEARERVAFSLLPHVNLALAIVAFGSYRASEHLRRKIIAAVVIPISGMSVVLLLDIVAAGHIDFGESSNFVTSGGFGPNRVAASLGLGALLCVLEATRERRPWLFAIEVATALWFSAQCLLTFSRGGIFAALIALATAFLYHAVRRGRLGRAVLVVAVTAAGLMYVVLPQLDTFTSGALNERFSSLETERTALAREDFALFRANPVLGVGVGGAAFARSTGVVTPSHTEYTRFLAEHGLLGLAAIVLLVAMAVFAVRHVEVLARPQALALFAWVFAQMSYANLRIAAVSFIFGFAGLRTGSASPAPPAAPNSTVDFSIGRG